MKWLLPAFLVCSALCLPLCVCAQGTQNEAPLTNAAVLKLTKAGFKEKTIIAIIAARVPRFDLGTDRMIELKRSGVSERIILAMLARQQGEDVWDDSWDDGVSLGEDSDKKDNGPGMANPPNGGSVDIFGSSGRTKGRTQSRGANGSIAQDTETTGSATVRILRPPSEAGAPAKLEKRPTLTNDSVVELVEAGFSEGTIVRRIEQSAVQFDLSSAKLEELRKHRVSDKILSAMKIAMGEESSK